MSHPKLRLPAALIAVATIAALTLTTLVAATQVPAVNLPPASIDDNEAAAAVRLLLHRDSGDAASESVSLWLVVSFVRFVLCTAFGLLFLIWWFQGSLLYMPSFGRAGESRVVGMNPRGFRSPAEYGLRFEDVWLRSGPRGDVLVHAWLVLQPHASVASAPTLLFLHGNAGNIGYRLPNVKSLYYTTGCNILIVDYSGYGGSAGEPSQVALEADGAAALKYLRERGSAPAAGPHAHAHGHTQARGDIDISRIHLFGRSLGGAVALHLAAADSDAQDLSLSSATGSSTPSGTYPPLAGVLVENTFLTLAEMVIVLAERIGIIRPSSLPPPVAAASSSSSSSSSSSAASEVAAAAGAVEPLSLRLFRLLLSLLMTSRWDNCGAVGRVRAPLLFLSGLADELIPPVHMATLWSKATLSRARTLHTVEHGTHNDTFMRGGTEYYEQIRTFFETTAVIQQQRTAAATAGAQQSGAAMASAVRA